MGASSSCKPVDCTEEDLIARYREAVDNTRRGGWPRHVGDLPPLQGLPRTPPRSPAHLPTGPPAAPNYPALAPANAQDIDGAWGRRNRGRKRCDAEEQRVEQHDDRRAPRSPPRYAERYPRYPQEVRGRHAEIVQRDRRKDVEEEQRRRRATARQQQHHEPDRQQHGCWQRGQAEQQQQRWDRLLRLECEMAALRGERIGAARDPPQHLARRDREDDLGAGWNQRRWG
ncbi:unnamed protein product [Phytophthora fragariaefolia]|uniref:Unnamed protein product n=1 Tax=Phytophthora fragariaefolia TaxID=1490495 RepID=A0A9W6YFM9_9STRA|nr:unnamed protein product [Phytophthora fragariaefolia]